MKNSRLSLFWRISICTQMPLHQVRCKLGQTLDYWFWSICLVELRKNPPNSVPELLKTVERYAAIAPIKIEPLLLRMMFYRECAPLLHRQLLIVTQGSTWHRQLSLALDSVMVHDQRQVIRADSIHVWHLQAAGWTCVMTPIIAF